VLSQKLGKAAAAKAVHPEAAKPQRRVAGKAAD
jgi:hypothetical protein